MFGRNKRDKPLILVVDDFKTTLLLIRKTLQQKGYQVVEAENGQAALDIFKETLPDLVLMDIQMPVMDGLTACRHLKKMPGDQQSPVLVFTGMEDEKSLEYAFEAGADDFIAKPLNREELAHRVRRLLHLKEIEETVHYQAHYDKLTGLPNRLLFLDRLFMAIRRACKENRMLAVFMLDMKDFKSINDAFGYDQGDLVLREVARRISTSVDEGDTVARLGGDRFAVLLPEISNLQEVTSFAERIISTVTDTCLVNRHEVKPYCNLGVSVYPNDGDTGQGMLVNAETAMCLAAGEPGNNSRFYNQKMNKRALERLSLENSLYHALERKEFLLYYQPLFSLKSGRIEGVEALLRWQNPGHGLVSPGQLISLAEETGLILPIGEWVLQEACCLGSYLQEKGHLPLRVGVNLSALQFSRQDLFETITTVLGNTSFEPVLLKLEITESMAMKDLDYSVKMMTRFRELGVMISLDDFGTGYSSLNSIKNMPFDELKIDMSFVRDIAHNPLDRVIVETIIALGRGLKVNLVAEGVETEEQLVLLKQMGCDQVQGFLFSKPVTAPTLVSLLDRQVKHQPGSPGPAS